MKKNVLFSVEEAREAALNVLLHNMKGPFSGLPRTAGWGYPEPYTRDLMISSLGILASGNKELIASLRKVLKTLSRNQSEHGHIPSLVHDPEDRGASDTTPLFLFAVALFRKTTGEDQFLDAAVEKALNWMVFQSPDDRIMVAQLPTSDWRDEQWVLGYSLFINSVIYVYLHLYGFHKKAVQLKELMNKFVIKGEAQQRHVHEGLVLRRKPYYAMWSYKVYKSERFDLLGNSLAILAGLVPPSRAKSIVKWIERECEDLREKRMLAVDMPPNLFPFIQPEDPDWRSRYEKFNRPGEYHNGGIWPFICGFYIPAIIKAGMPELAKKKLKVLSELLIRSRNKNLSFGCNEWIRARDGKPGGQDWQTWSAAMYLYAYHCVDNGRTIFF